MKHVQNHAQWTTMFHVFHPHRKHVSGDHCWKSRIKFPDLTMFPRLRFFESCQFGLHFPWRRTGVVGHGTPCDTAKPLSFIKDVLVDLTFLHLAAGLAKMSENNEFQILVTQKSIQLSLNSCPGHWISQLGLSHETAHFWMLGPLGYPSNHPSRPSAPLLARGRKARASFGTVRRRISASRRHCCGVLDGSPWRFIWMYVLPKVDRSY